MSSSFDRNVMDCHTDFSCHINLIKRLKTSWGQTKFTWLQNKCRSCSDLSHFENKVVLGLRSKVVYGCRNLSTTLIVITVYFQKQAEEIAEEAKERVEAKMTLRKQNLDAPRTFVRLENSTCRVIFCNRQFAVDQTRRHEALSLLLQAKFVMCSLFRYYS